MTSSELNPSQHVERIREILIGRDLQNMHGRLARIEGSLENKLPEQDSSQFEEAIMSLQQDQASIHQELNFLKKQKDRIPHLAANSAQHDSPVYEHSSSELTAQIDARFREIISHFQNEISQLKGQMDEHLHSLKSQKADRVELHERFTRLAHAASYPETENESAKDQIEGFLL